MLEEKVLYDILEKGNYVEKEILDKATKTASAQKVSLSEVLLVGKVITKDILGQAIAEHYKVPYADLNSNVPTKEQVLLIPEAKALSLRIVLFKVGKKKAVVATDNPSRKGLKTTIKKILPKYTISIAYSSSEDIDTILTFYRKTLDTRFSKIIENQGRIAPEILDEIFSDALLYNASDIHFEPHPQTVLIRFRIDGVLQQAGAIPKEYYENILNRIKVQSRLRIDEHFTAQDGSMRHTSGDITFDIRTSIVPTVEGEKIVLRLLTSYVRRFEFTELGMSLHLAHLVETYSHVPFGMILTTGPTGSGKSTTLYSIVKGINRPEVNITTIEDPVEYRVEGINQIQVNQQANLTFAKGLRSIVRQDPDIILVGEIRDAETAEIAVNAALTGHLLFSTFHSNDSATAIPRLLDMGIEPFLLASTLQLLIAQRLVRKLCEECRYSESVTVASLEKKMPGIGDLIDAKTITIYKGKGCSKCNNSGFKGRIGIFEFIEVTPEMRDVILTHPSSQEVWDIAREAGSVSLFEDGLEKVIAGITTLEELARVASIVDENQKKSKKEK